MTDGLQSQLAARALGQTYGLERELGGGGMSRVFAAEERPFGRLAPRFAGLLRRVAPER